VNEWRDGTVQVHCIAVALCEAGSVYFRYVWTGIESKSSQGSLLHKCREGAASSRCRSGREDGGEIVEIGVCVRRWMDGVSGGWRVVPCIALNCIA
jgi:hypothetical protein